MNESHSSRGPSRRETLRWCLAGACAPAAPLSPAARDAGAHDDGDALDEALARIHDALPRAKQGLSTHAPMVAEALCSLGRADRAVAWVEAYDAPWIDVPQPAKRIERERWREALGPDTGAVDWERQVSRWGDWTVLFTEELAEARWQDVLDRWTARLAPGLSGAATHGLIRTAHAARGLGRKETPERRAELAQGLAYWASAYEELPARAHSERAPDLEAALARVPTYWKEKGHAPGGHNIVEGLRHVPELPTFADARDLVAVPDDVGAALSALTAAFARVYLRNGTHNNTIAFVHGITAPCALRRLAPHVSPATARAAFPYAWQAAAAIYAAYARPENEAPPLEPTLAPDELAARAVENGADHAIKLTEVLLSEHALAPDPAYLAAAEDVVARL